VIFEQTVVLSDPFDTVVERVKEAFAEQGFGVLTEIDLQATLAQKVGKEMDRYLIIGACNPQLASRAVDVLPRIGALLPCNVVVRETDQGVAVEAMDPGLMATLTGDDAVTPIADEARRRVGDAMEALGPSADGG
jgi:uncharacterized protein (DUF302 family)